MDFRILGPLQVVSSGRTLRLDAPKPRALLAIMLLHENELVASDRLIEELWGGRPPATAAKVLQTYVSQLRRVLGEGLLLTRPPGYELRLERGQLDLHRVERLVAEARVADAATTAKKLREALALWRGPPLADFLYEPFAQTHIARLEELRLGIVEQRIDADLELGWHADLVGEVEALVAEHPLRERLRGQLILALYRCGRQAEALAAYREARRTLVEELGLEPGSELERLEREILHHDPRLDAPEAAEVPSPTAEPLKTRKPVTALFAQLSGWTAMVERLDPETVHRLVSRYYADAARVVERHGGTVTELAGELAVGLFGVPVAYEDDPLRAIRAALELRWGFETLEEELRADGVEVGLKLAIETGEVIAEVDPRGARAPFVVGHAPDVAARLVRAADPGEILIGSYAHRLLADAVRAERLAPLDVGRRDMPVDAWRLLDLRPERPAFASPFVGREAEVATLRNLLTRATGERSCRLCTITGPPGIGKSRLAKEFLAAECGEATVAVGRCPSYGEGITYWPLREIVRDLAGVVRGSGDFSLHDEAPCAFWHPVACGFSQPGLFPPAPVQGTTVEETVWVAREHRACEPAKDMDGDGLLDCWETEGVDVDGDGDTDLDLPAMGADPEHKDVFVEVDAMAGHALSQAAIDTVVAAFGVAPVSNPDKTPGINLHVDNGPGSTMNPVTGELWGPLSDADTVAHVDMLGETTATGKYNWHDFQNIKNANFSSDRQPVFHYALSAHEHMANHSSGISRNDSGAFFTGASDFLVTLGGACASHPCSPAGLQPGMFMHELGHNLGLAHGGNDHLNRKPNYLSVMSYAFQFPGLIVNGAAGRYDYSRFGAASLAVLNESQLNETTGFGATDSRLSAYDTLIHCTAGGGWQQVPVTGAQDWDCQPSPNIVSENISNEDGLTLLGPFDDWPNLVFSGGAVGDLGAAIELPMETELIEPPLSVLLETACLFDPTLDGCPDDTTAPATSATAAPAPNPAGWNNGDVTVTLSASDEEGGSGVEEIVYSLGSDPTVVAGATARIEITSEGESVLTYFARDNAGNAEQAKTLTIRLDKTAPAINTSRAPDANAAGWNNSPVTGRFTATDDLSGIEGESSFEVVFGEGAGQSATRTFTDRAGNSASATIANVNVDLTAPTMSCVASPDVLWPPNHRLREVSVRVSIADGLSGAGPFALAAATSSEPDNGAGDGNTTGDVREFGLGLADTEGMLRAERSGSGRGRVYELRYGGGDIAGNTATCVARVAVPLDAVRDRVTWRRR